MPVLQDNADRQTKSAASMPRLLVSVRDLPEAELAIDGGCDIVDIKEPQNGALGMASAATINQIAARCARANRPSSTALGEVLDWNTEDAESLSLSDELSFAKLGLAGLSQQSNWIESWMSVRSFVDSQRDLPLSWIAVAYADTEAALSPSLREVLDAAISTNCKGLLIDTTTKRPNGSMLDYVDVEELASVARIAQENRLLFAIAGQIGSNQLPATKCVAPDIIAVRSAVCSGFDRQTNVDQSAVALLKRQIEKCFANDA